MKIVSPDYLSNLVAVRLLSETATVRPQRRNRFVPLKPTVIKPANPLKICYEGLMDLRPDNPQAMRKPGLNF